MKKVLLTGAAGAIGVHMIAHIMHNTDWEVIGIDSFREEHKGYFDRIIEMLDTHEEWGLRLKMIAHDLNAPLTDRQIKDIGPIDYIINLASRSDVKNSVDDPLPFIRNNTELMLTILEFARKVKVKAFIQFSTDEVYGPSEKDSVGHKEWDVILPSNPYSASKAIQESLAIAWWRCYGIPVIITNTMNNFGEMQAPSKFPAMIQNILQKDGEVQIHSTEDGEIGSRYYIHARNSADAILFILRDIEPYSHKVGEIDRPLRYNIVGDKQLNNLELAQVIAKLMGKELKYKLSAFHKSNPGHDLHYGLDGSLLEEAGWESPVSFEESMKSTIDWQRENPKWME